MTTRKKTATRARRTQLLMNTGCGAADAVAGAAASAGGDHQPLHEAAAAQQEEEGEEEEQSKPYLPFTRTRTAANRGKVRARQWAEDLQQQPEEEEGEQLGRQQDQSTAVEEDRTTDDEDFELPAAATTARSRGGAKHQAFQTKPAGVGQRQVHQLQRDEALQLLGVDGAARVAAANGVAAAAGAAAAAAGGGAAGGGATTAVAAAVGANGDSGAAAAAAAAGRGVFAAFSVNADRAAVMKAMAELVAASGVASTQPAKRWVGWGGVGWGGVGWGEGWGGTVIVPAATNSTTNHSTPLRTRYVQGSCSYCQEGSGAEGWPQHIQVQGGDSPCAHRALGEPRVAGGQTDLPGWL